MKRVRAKKSLGQHFLTDKSVALRIVEAMQADGLEKVLEIGPGMGVLTDFLVENKAFETSVVEIDTESVTYLNEHKPELAGRIWVEDFLKMDLTKFSDKPFGLIGNFPYNISSQILFKVLDNKDLVPEVVGMLQKEVAERITSGPGTKNYGILSVLLQAYYHTEYLFTVDEHVFSPPPKVKSGVLRLVRNDVEKLPCNERLFKNIIKMGFNQRRKTLRNSIKALIGKANIPAEILAKRPEQLAVQQFIEITQWVEQAQQEESAS